MEIEIKLKCSICEAWLNGGQRLETPDTLIFVQPCPNCHPAKPEKVTPKDGETVEARNTDWDNGIFNNRKATGKRSDITKLVAARGVHRGRHYYDQWRYPGETEWRD